MAGSTPLRVLGRGLLAGAAGTAVMTAYQELVQRGGAESGQGEDAWERAPSPAKVARRALRGLYGVDPSPERIPLLTHAVHWGYGTALGAAYGLVHASLRPRPLLHGLGFGAAVWAASYVQLVPMGVYRPPWEYSPRTLAEDLSYHVVYGLGVAGGYAALERG